MVNRKKILFFLHDDISGNGNLIGINEKASRRVKFRASNDRSLVDKKSVSLKLYRFKVFLI